MIRFSLLCMTGAAVFFMAMSASVPASEAAPACRASVEGSASGFGLLGRGSRRARIKAQIDWERKVEGLYGRRFARFSTARSVIWNCRGGTVAPAKCVVRARPCRA